MKFVKTLLARIQKTIHAIRNPSDEKLFAKAVRLYTDYSGYVYIQHTRKGVVEALVRREEMKRILEQLTVFPANAQRTQLLKETLVKFRQYNRIGFR